MTLQLDKRLSVLVNVSKAEHHVVSLQRMRSVDLEKMDDYEHSDITPPMVYGFYSRNSVNKASEHIP